MCHTDSGAPPNGSECVWRRREGGAAGPPSMFRGRPMRRGSAGAAPSRVRGPAGRGGGGGGRAGAMSHAGSGAAAGGRHAGSRARGREEPQGGSGAARPGGARLGSLCSRRRRSVPPGTEQRSCASPEPRRAACALPAAPGTYNQSRNDLGWKGPEDQSRPCRGQGHRRYPGLPRAPSSLGSQGSRGSRSIPVAAGPPGGGGALRAAVTPPGPGTRTRHCRGWQRRG